MIFHYRESILTCIWVQKMSLTCIWVQKRYFLAHPDDSGFNWSQVCKREINVQKSLWREEKNTPSARVGFHPDAALGYWLVAKSGRMSNGPLMFANAQGIGAQLDGKDFCLELHLPALLSDKSDPIARW